MRIGSVLHSSGGKPGCKEPSTFPACQLRLRPAESALRLTPLEALVIEHGFIRLISRDASRVPSAKALSKDHIWPIRNRQRKPFAKRLAARLPTRHGGVACGARYAR